MQRFRHKTTKTKFKLVPAFAIVHLVAIALIAVYLVRGGM